MSTSTRARTRSPHTTHCLHQPKVIVLSERAGCWTAAIIEKMAASEDDTTQEHGTASKERQQPTAQHRSTAVKTQEDDTAQEHGRGASCTTHPLTPRFFTLISK